MYSVLPLTRDARSLPLRRNVARVLLVDSCLASRLTIGAVLSTAGYAVDCAATSAEAVTNLDANEYQLVLADLSGEPEGAGDRLLAFARQKDFHPATALFSSESSSTLSDENISFLLMRAADLIGERADRRMRRDMMLRHR